jgi:hypothetical protein
MGEGEEVRVVVVRGGCMLISEMRMPDLKG